MRRRVMIATLTVAVLVLAAFAASPGFAQQAQLPALTRFKMLRQCSDSTSAAKPLWGSRGMRSPRPPHCPIIPTALESPV